MSVVAEVVATSEARQKQLEFPKIENNPEVVTLDPFLSATTAQTA